MTACCDKAPHLPGLAFYTSAQNDKGQYIALTGPYPTHEAALAAVEADKKVAWDRDPRAPWYAYGTFSAPVGNAIRPVLREIQ